MGVISGVNGQIRWSYYVAATITSYRLERINGRWWMEGTAVNANPYNMAQRPLVFVSLFKRGKVGWPVTGVFVGGRSVQFVPSGMFPIQLALGPPLEGTDA